MDFSYSENHNDLKQLAEEILGDYSDVERLKKMEADGPWFDKALWQKLVESGIHSASLPTTLGGMGMDFHAAMQVAETIGRTVVSIPYIPCVVSAALPLLSVLNNKAALEAVSGLINGETLLTTALIEPGNEDPFDPTVSAHQQGEQWFLNGSKHCVPYAADANNILLFAKQNNELWAGLVNTKQVSVTLTQQFCTANELQYRIDLKDTSAQCLALGETAQLLLQQSVAMTTAAYCTMAVGVADKMTRISGEYTSERKQFGVAIATFQAVAHRLADCYIDVETLKIISMKAASDVNQGSYGTDTVHMAKMFCGDVLARISQAAQHVHGGMGIDRDYHLFRYCLWAKQLELSLGNSKQHLAALADKLEARYLTACNN